MLKEGRLMGPNKSLDFPLQVITALLSDVQTLHSDVFTPKALKLTVLKVSSRCRQEGVSFLTKTLPRLGKALDRALAEQEPLNCAELGVETQPGSRLPKLFGELFSLVLDHSGVVLPDADVKSVASLRQLLYCFYKYELPYDTKTEQGVIEAFKTAEDDIESVSDNFEACLKVVHDDNDWRGYMALKPEWLSPIIRRARRLLHCLFASFDRRDIFPRHGPGAVADKLKPWDKYVFGSIPERLTNEFPLDEYFVSGLNMLVDSFSWFQEIDVTEPFARVCLVPKDSRGPRVISCEPAALQWIQQGLRDAIYRLVESHPLTCEEVRFTDQAPNQYGALLGSRTGKYATLDLKEASDRVTWSLVRLLFPGQVLPALEASRSLGTILPSGQKMFLRKFAPMGSALCFPIMALTIWALLKAGLKECDATDEFWQQCPNPLVYVYGDDVIVETAQAAHAIEILEAVGLRINRDKSCTRGFFRESCGVDAYRGHRVTPVRIKTVWSSSRCPNILVSYIDYARSMWERGYKACYKLIVDRLLSVYGNIPDEGCGVSAPSLPLVPEVRHLPRRRWSYRYQRYEYLCWDVEASPVKRQIDGWRMVLRYFAESCSSYESARTHNPDSEVGPTRPLDLGPGFRVREYTLRGRNKLRLCWR